MNREFWTRSGARLKLVKGDARQGYRWLFLPGGPGLGSESLTELIQMLKLPGVIWTLDLPGDGSNIVDDNNDNLNFANWQKALIEAAGEFDNTILVAHSSGGMFALATPEIEKNLTGLVLMDSAPNAGWQQCFMEYINKNPLPKANILQKEYQLHPTDNLLKQLTIASAPCFSLPQNLEQIITLLEKLPFNHHSHLWAEKYFDQSYKARWIPKIPTLIFSGEKDFLTPLKLFSQEQLYHKDNILIREINDAAHFPWIDNPEAVKELFNHYCGLLPNVTT